MPTRHYAPPRLHTDGYPSLPLAVDSAAAWRANTYSCLLSVVLTQGHSAFCTLPLWHQEEGAAQLTKTSTSPVYAHCEGRAWSALSTCQASVPTHQASVTSTFAVFESQSGRLLAASPMLEMSRLTAVLLQPLGGCGKSEGG